MGAWGYGLFQSDHDFDMIGDLSHEAGLTKLEEDAKASAKAEGKTDKEADRIYYTIYGNDCSDPPLVRKHLDSGILLKMIAAMESKMLTNPSGVKERLLNYWLSDPCYVYVLLGACAMTLGCQLRDSYVAMLKKVYTEGGLMPDALKQMKKALFGPSGYKNGEPYDFESRDLLETANAMPEKESEPDRSGVVFMNVRSPGGLFNTGMGGSTTSVVIKELRQKFNGPNACGSCGAAASWALSTTGIRIPAAVPSKQGMGCERRRGLVFQFSQPW